MDSALEGKSSASNKVKFTIARLSHSYKFAELIPKVMQVGGELHWAVLEFGRPKGYWLAHA